jgi:ATP-dependent RNA helicase DDX46/PRP5
MAPKDARSPSPVGSHYSHSSKRARRDDDRAPRDRRDDGYSRRSPPGVRSRYSQTSYIPTNRSQQRRDRDRYDQRDSHHRATDRRRDDDHRSSRRERSRDRYRDDGRLIDRDTDRRRRSRDRGYRDRRDDSRDRPYRRDDDDRDYKHKDKRDEARGSVNAGRTHEVSSYAALDLR